MKSAVTSKKLVEKVARRALEWSMKEKPLPDQSLPQREEARGSLLVEEAPFLLEEVPLLYHHLLTLYPQLVHEYLPHWPALAAAYHCGGEEGVAFAHHLLSHLPTLSPSQAQEGYATYRHCQSLAPRGEKLWDLKGLPKPQEEDPYWKVMTPRTRQDLLHLVETGEGFLLQGLPESHLTAPFLHRTLLFQELKDQGQVLRDLVEEEGYEAHSYRLGVQGEPALPEDALLPREALLLQGYYELAALLHHELLYRFGPYGATTFLTKILGEEEAIFGDKVPSLLFFINKLSSPATPAPHALWRLWRSGKRLVGQGALPRRSY